MRTVRFWPWLAAIFSGVLLTLCFSPFDQDWLCWVALTPLSAAVWFGGGASIKRAALLGYVTGLVFFWGVFSWLTTVTAVGWFFLAFYLALFPAAWAAFLGAVRPGAGDFTRSLPNLLLATLGASAWVALEWLRGLGAISFGWDGLGVALHRSLSLIQIAEFTGVGGVSFLVAFTNLIALLTVLRLYREVQLGRFRAHLDFSFNMLLIAGVFGFGASKFLAPADQTAFPLRVAAVQADIPQTEKFDPEFNKMICERYAALTECALASRPQLLLWPESATPGSMFGSQELFDFVRGFAQRGDINFLLGTLDFDKANNDYNIAALFTNHGETLQTYRKMHLVPFGEYIPWRHAFPPFEWIIGKLVPSDFTPGTQHTILQMKDPQIKVGALVCFEDTLGDLTRRFVKGEGDQGGAQLLVNVTNDGWFLRSQGSAQHLANAVFRAVENRRPLLRAANTGVTAFIDPLGRITHSFKINGGPFGKGFLAGTVTIPAQNAPQTFYTRQGERFSQACAVLTLGALGSLALRRRNPFQSVS